MVKTPINNSFLKVSQGNIKIDMDTILQESLSRYKFASVDLFQKRPKVEQRILLLFHAFEELLNVLVLFQFFHEIEFSKVVVCNLLDRALYFYECVRVAFSGH